MYITLRNHFVPTFKESSVITYDDVGIFLILKRFVIPKIEYAAYYSVLVITRRILLYQGVKIIKNKLPDGRIEQINIETYERKILPANEERKILPNE